MLQQKGGATDTEVDATVLEFDANNDTESMAGLAGDSTVDRTVLSRRPSSCSDYTCARTTKADTSSSTATTAPLSDVNSWANFSNLQKAHAPTTASSSSSSDPPDTKKSASDKKSTSSSTSGNSTSKGSNGNSSQRTSSYSNSSSSWWSSYGSSSSSSEPPAKKDYAGLRNHGATCYLNSLLQSLFMTPEFRAAVFQMKCDVEKFPIPFQLQRLFAKLQLTDKYAVSTRSLIRSFGWTDMESLYQHDAQELCRLLFDALEAALKASNQPNIIEQLYQGEMKSYVRCRNCLYESSRMEKYLDISLDIFGHRTLQEALSSFVQPEVLNGKNKYSCPKCEQQVDADKGLSFTSLPPILMLHLKRFNYEVDTWNNELKRVKLGHVVEFPATIDLASYLDVPEEPPYVTVIGFAYAVVSVMSAAVEEKIKKLKAEIERHTLIVQKTEFNTKHVQKRAKAQAELNKLQKGTKQSPLLYELLAVLVHSGSTTGGHFYALIKSFERDKWYEFNDSSVYGRSESDLKRVFGDSYLTPKSGWVWTSTTTAYMLIYRKQRPENIEVVLDDEIPENVKQTFGPDKVKSTPHAIAREHSLTFTDGSPKSKKNESDKKESDKKEPDKKNGHNDDKDNHTQNDSKQASASNAKANTDDIAGAAKNDTEMDSGNVTDSDETGSQSMQSSQCSPWSYSALPTPSVSPEPSQADECVGASPAGAIDDAIDRLCVEGTNKRNHADVSAMDIEMHEFEDVPLSPAATTKKGIVHIDLYRDGAHNRWSFDLSSEWRNVVNSMVPHPYSGQDVRFCEYDPAKYILGKVYPSDLTGPISQFNWREDETKVLVLQVKRPDEMFPSDMEPEYVLCVRQLDTQRKMLKPSFDVFVHPDMKWRDVRDKIAKKLNICGPDYLRVFHFRLRQLVQVPAGEFDTPITLSLHCVSSGAEVYVEECYNDSPMLAAMGLKPAERYLIGKPSSPANFEPRPYQLAPNRGTFAGNNKKMKSEYVS